MFKAAKDKSEQEQDKEKTLDLLDELLYSIHSTRARVLEARTRKYEKRLAKRQEKSKMSSRRNRGSFINQTDVDFEVDGIMDEMAAEFSEPTLTVKTASLRADSKNQNSAAEVLKKLSIGKSDTHIEPEPFEPTAAELSAHEIGIPGKAKSDQELNASTKGKNSKFKPAKILQGSNEAFHPNEQHGGDLKVVEIFNEFKKELETWFNNEKGKRDDIDARGNMADHLTNKYLSKKLDPLPMSQTTSNFRKRISKVIEELASAVGMLPANWCDKVLGTMSESTRDPTYMKTGPTAEQKLLAMQAKQQQLQEELQTNATTANADKTVAKKLEFGDQDIGGASKVQNVTAGDVSSAKKGVKFGSTTAATTATAPPGASAAGSGSILKESKPTKEEAQQAERLRIQRQYEAYHAKKRELEAADAPDAAAVAANQELQDDIRSLLSTIQQRA